MTYNEILTEIRRVYCDELAGSGKFTKEELLADRLCAIMSVRKSKPVLELRQDALLVGEASESGSVGAVAEGSVESSIVRGGRRP